MDTFWPFQFVRAAFRFCSFNCTHPAPLSLSSSGVLRSYFFFAAYCTTPCCYNLHLPQCIFRCFGFVNNCCIFLIVSALCTAMVNHFCESCNTYARYPFCIFIHSRRSRTRNKLFETIPSKQSFRRLCQLPCSWQANFHRNVYIA